MNHPSNIMPRPAENTSTDDRDNRNNDISTAQNRGDENHNMQNLICFWIIGLCNGYGWTVMLSAAFDIIKRLNGVSVRN